MLIGSLLPATWRLPLFNEADFDETEFSTMNPTLRIVLFLSTVIGVTVGLHVYFYLRLVRDTSLPSPWRRLATFVVLTLLLSLIGAMFLRRLLPFEATRWVMTPIYLWMGMMFYVFLLLLSGDLLRLGVRVSSWIASREAPDPQRRLFLSRLLGGAAVAGATAIATLSTRRALALSRVVVEKVEVPLARLPRALDGFRIAQLSDLHIGPTLGKEWLEGIVARTNALGADAIVITGDLVDGSVKQLREDIAPLTKLKAREGVYLCTGNHEYYSGAVEWCAEFSRMGLKVLRNERVAIGRDVRDSERDASRAASRAASARVTFDLAGIDDYNARAEGEAGHGPDLNKALAGRDAERELVLLAHQPRHIHEAAAAKVGLQLSGHTHGGQLWPWHYLVKLQQPYLSGLVDHQGSKLYISQGTGFWGPPLRLGSHAEISLITLRASS
jgi:predicted MPP superfamily phosphohydrolase